MLDFCHRRMTFVSSRPARHGASGGRPKAQVHPGTAGAASSRGKMQVVDATAGQ